jgi:hypothetical protein
MWGSAMGLSFSPVWAASQLADHLFQHGLPDGVSEPLAPPLLRGVSLAEARQAAR